MNHTGHRLCRLLRNAPESPDHAAEDVNHPGTDPASNRNETTLPGIPAVDHRPEPQAHEQPESTGEQNEESGGHGVAQSLNIDPITQEKTVKVYSIAMRISLGPNDAQYSR